MVNQDLHSDVPSRVELPPPLALPGWVAAALVFGSSGAVLLLEVLAVRLVAPYVGINLQVNSAVIGIALAAIALGAWVGGRLADSRDSAGLIGRLLVAGGLTTLLVLPLVRWVGGVLNGTSPVAVIGLASLAIFVPAFLLSTVSPLVIKLQLRDLHRTGRVVGRLSGLGTLGGIVATFLTGFVLVATLPSSTILLITGCLLVAGGIVTTLALRGQRAATAAIVIALALVGSGLTVWSPRACDAESAYNCIRVVAHPDDPSVRVLKLSTSEHSYVDMDEPTRIHMGYVQALAAALDTARPQRSLDGFHIGGGGMTLPTYLRGTRPGGRQTVYEIDPGLIELNRRELGLREDDRLRVFTGDGRMGLRVQPDDSYDVVVEDAFGAHSPPWHLTTREVVREAKRVVRPGGYYLANLIDFPPNNFARAAVATVRETFKHVVLISYAAILDGKTGGNVVIVASDDELPVDEVQRNLVARDSSGLLTMADEERTARYAGGADVLTDDYAPVDQLITVPLRYW